MEKSKRASSRKAKKAQKTRMLILPLVEGVEMSKLMAALNAAGLKGGSAKACGSCDDGMGVSWCNAMVPAAHYKLSITREM